MNLRRNGRQVSSLHFASPSPVPTKYATHPPPLSSQAGSSSAKLAFNNIVEFTGRDWLCSVQCEKQRSLRRHEANGPTEKLGCDLACADERNEASLPTLERLVHRLLPSFYERQPIRIASSPCGGNAKANLALYLK